MKKATCFLIAGILISILGTSALGAKEAKETAASSEEIWEEHREWQRDLIKKEVEVFLKKFSSTKEEKIHYSYLPPEYSNVYTLSQANLLALILEKTVILIGEHFTEEFSLELLNIDPEPNYLSISMNLRYHPTKKSYEGGGYFYIKESLEESIREIIKYAKVAFPVNGKNVKISISIANLETTAVFEDGILRLDEK